MRLAYMLKILLFFACYLETNVNYTFATLSMYSISVNTEKAIIPKYSKSTWED